ncbi:twin-arginine translocase subunit TatC [Psychrobacillus sp. L4]|uniref:twin-arginine translocase subunit TatC n=1 Tax=Psychrobacillus sp. L4 TaxID=3236892 RepID=UPI0036F43962
MTQEPELTLVEHLTELRKRLIIIIATFVLSLALGFWMAPKTLHFLKQQPTAAHVEWNVFGYTDGLMIYIKCALILAILITLPIAMYQIWLFVKPGLLEKESKGTIYFIPISFFLFLAGISFSYFILFPLMLNFMKSINDSIGAVETYGMQQYFTFMFNLITPVGIVFELPVIVLFLTKLGIVTPDRLRKMRKISYIVLAVVGAAITPPDFLSEIIIIIPLLILFEISVFVSNWSYKKQQTKKILIEDLEE